MTDTLRERIAEAIATRDPLEDWCGKPINWADISEGHRECYRRDADAILATLGLKPEWSLKSTIYTNPLIHPYRSREDAVADRGGASEERRKDLSLMCRYVTEWENDD